MHIINKLTLDIACTTEVQALELRRNFSQSKQNEISEVIEKVCSKYVGDDEWIKLDRIEVDLGTFDIHNFERIFTKLFLEKFDRLVAKKVQAVPADKKEISKQSTFFESFIHFLEHGSLPWWMPSEKFEIHSVAEEILQNQQKEFIAFLIAHKERPIVWKRIGFQLKPSIQHRIIAFFGELALAKRTIIHWFSSTPKEEKTTAQTLPVDEVEMFAQQIILQNAPIFFRFKLEENAMNESGKTTLRKVWEHAMTNGLNPTQTMDTIMQTIKKEINTDQSFTSESKPDRIAAQLFKGPETAETDQPEKWLVKQAGIVLLAPYFSRFFTALGLWQGNDWKDRWAHYKAIYLLGYLSTGETSLPEHNLALEKLLCGMEMAAPIPANIELMPEELAEADDLLQSVIDNWKALKNTSKNGLRQTFLQREGIVSKKENGWLIQVERKTPDVLLESIPWGYSTFSASWSDDILFIEW